MKLRILYFARLRDAMGRAGEELEVPLEIGTVGQLRAWLVQRGSPWREALTEVRSVRSAVDQIMSDDATPIGKAAEVAFFPPVTGG